ncbi:Carboxylesterase family-domain-containing protein [Pterulicium gracile]|uniref:Carboxylesterase family-domain-containing protein n=1 Tax=Pterulicium gracile TaxID=1884261 RepID=A0A5C3Q6F2_9AGAR|nr:Carboxylesterase family-domain-containing protein [Pterula gracilis]
MAGNRLVNIDIEGCPCEMDKLGSASKYSISFLEGIHFCLIRPRITQAGSADAVLLNLAVADLASGAHGRAQSLALANLSPINNRTSIMVAMETCSFNLADGTVLETHEFNQRHHIACMVPLAALTCIASRIRVVYRIVAQSAMYAYSCTSQVALGSPIAAPLEPRTLRDELTVDVEYSKYVVTSNNATRVVDFLGIRYGKSPTGSLRFAAAQAPAVIDRSTRPTVIAKKQPNACKQNDFGFAPTSQWNTGGGSGGGGDNGGGVGGGGRGASLSSLFTTRALDTRAEDVPQSEDCLFLNIHVPHTFGQTTHNAFPVVMWFHGGGYAHGAESTYNGSLLNTTFDNQVITIVIQYRLGLFEVLTHHQADGCSGAETVSITQEAAMFTMQEDMDAPSVCALVNSDSLLALAHTNSQIPHFAFMRAAKITKRQITPQVVQEFRDWGAQYERK